MDVLSFLQRAISTKMLEKNKKKKLKKKKTTQNMGKMVYKRKDSYKTKRNKTFMVKHNTTKWSVKGFGMEVGTEKGIK